MSLSEKDEEIHKMSLGIKVVDDGLEVLAAVHQKIPLIQKLCADVDYFHSNQRMQNVPTPDRLTKICSTLFRTTYCEL